MTTPGRRQQIAEAAARLKAKRKEAGLARIEIWAHADDHEALKALAVKLADARRSNSKRSLGR